MILDNINLMFEQHPTSWVVTLAVISLMMGSFLNVVIHRLPKMLEKSWYCDCRELLADELSTDKESKNAKSTSSKPRPYTATETYNLVVPNSTCPKCQQAIKPWQNIPIVSWLFLRGKCASCANPISMRYPVVELITGLMGGFAAWHFGYSFAAVAALVFTFCLIAMTFIDFDTMLLPDQLTLPLLWLGLLVNTQATFVNLNDAVIGAVIGYLSLWSIFWLFKLLTGKEGMGYGDFKLLAALGAWMGYQALLPIILISSFVGAILGIIILKTQSANKAEENENGATAIPFGPYLAIAGWIAFYWRDDLIQYYVTHFL
ncbi:prepilin peptidase [Algibacillus agarilyticus]|uniref:prepilin peptidase n=1 Tax=Algibacillus agarilyticus TaxID=2234133 RepID=UPI0022B8393E|nr:A24 family peptidase [Algibacillus agarilyticus]